MDLTTQFFDTVAIAGEKLGWSQERVLRLHSNDASKLNVRKSSFVSQALTLQEEITQAMSFLSQNAMDYCRSGRLSEGERDRIEEEGSLIIKAATKAIEALKNQVSLCDVLEGAAGEPAAVNISNLTRRNNAAASGTGRSLSVKPNESQIAHRHGILLILSAELRLVVDAFSKLKAQRYKEAMEARRRKEKAMKMIESVVRPVPQPLSANQAALSQENGQLQHSLSAEQSAVQQAVLAERNSLLQEFGDLTQRVRQAESTLTDISHLSTMLTEQVLTQSHTIELLYRDAISATFNISRGNEQLKKTVDVRKSARLYLAMYLLVCALGVLFLDYYHS